MDSIAALVVLIRVVIFQGWMQLRQQQQHFRVQDKLMDRVMARNFETYVHGQVTQVPPEIPLTLEQIMAQQQERGIPVG